MNAHTSQANTDKNDDGNVIVNGASGLCPGVTGAGTTNYTTADLYACNSSLSVGVSENWTVG